MRALANKIRRAILLYKRSGGRYIRMNQTHPPFPICVGSARTALYAPDSEEARATYCEVIVQDDYRILALAKREQIRRIIDIGANIGAFSLFATLVFPEAIVEAYEPHPQAFQWLQKNAVGTPIVAVQCAVSDVDSEIRFDAKATSTLSKVAVNGTLIVPAISSSKLAAGQEIDLIKMDCEGSEFSILRNPALLQRARNLVCEYHLDAAIPL